MIRELEARLAPRVAKFLTRNLRGVAARSNALHPDLHPEIRIVVGLSHLSGNGGGLVDQPIPKARRAMARGTRLVSAPPVPVTGVRDLLVDGAAGPLPARHYVSGHGKRRPLLVFLHGGGFCLGDLDTHDQPCRTLCAEGGFDVLSIAYRLAPEHPFPAGLDDARAALRWARANASVLDVDPERIGMGGDSAGATLTTVVSHLNRDAGEPGPCLQLLIYPGTDRSTDYPSKQLYGERLVLTRTDLRVFTEHYTAGRVPPDDPRLSPLKAASLTGLPPAIVITAGCDPLRDEGDAYATALQAAGVRVKHMPMPGMVHGFIHMADVSPTAASHVQAIARAASQEFARA